MILRRNTLIFFLSICIFVGSCQEQTKIPKVNRENEVLVKTLPLHIADSLYGKLEDSLLFDFIVNVKSLYGGLKPQYPMAMGVNYSNAYGNLFRRGCSNFAYSLIVQIDNEFRAIRNNDDLKTIFSPIESIEEALSYALISTNLDVIYVFDLNPTYRFFTDSFFTTYSKETKGGYEVALYNYNLCGCGPHTHSMVKLFVSTDGEISVIEKIKLYENPEIDGLCVD